MATTVAIFVTQIFLPEDHSMNLPVQSKVQTAMIGCGRMAYWHVKAMLAQQDTTNIRVICEPSPTAYQKACELFQENGLTPPPNEPDLDRLLGQYGPELNA